MNIKFERNIEVRNNVDVFIAGGGPSGVAAAVTAARKGAKVFLCEAHSCLGGMGTAGMVPMFMQFSDGINFVADGFGHELLDRLVKAEGTGPEDKRTIKTEVLKRVYDEMLTESGADFSFGTSLIGVEKDGSRVKYAVCAAKSGIFAVEAKVFVDCSGDGDLAAMAGNAFSKGDENGNTMPGTLCSLWANLDWKNILPPNDRNHARYLEEAFKENMFSVEDRHLSCVSHTSQSTGTGNVGHTFGVDGLDERSITKALIWARKSLVEYQRYYRKYIRGFEQSEIAGSGSLLGIRETRRITGDHILTIQDFLKRAIFNDEIGRYCYEIDIHPTTSNVKDFQQFTTEINTYKYKPGESYGIPYRSIIASQFSNLLMAGRCISTDRYMQSSVRTMPCCYITGQAAGMAAAIVSGGDCITRNISIRSLQKSLKQIGAFLPNAS